METSTMAPLAVSVDEAARMAGIGRSTLYELIGDGSLRSITVGRRRLIRVADLDEWLARQAEATGHVAQAG